MKERDRKQHWELKDMVLEALQERPMNSSQLSKKVGTSQSTVKRHLQELKDLSKVRKAKVEIRGKEKEVWEIP
ncbi:MAG: ArsR family transcriptional regulator [Candidatus Nanohaloarchaea archaeon]